MREIPTKPLDLVISAGLLAVLAVICYRILAPFLGLLGTVWGVMDAFGGIARAGSANLAAMAPGVSGALITTVVGLLVAIPAMFGYNFLVVSVRSEIVKAENFAAELASEIEHRYVEHGNRPA